jgi:hypothetical protein
MAMTQRDLRGQTIDRRGFDDPDRSDPDRPDGRHLGSARGIGVCFSAHVARLENPRLVADAPEYAQKVVLRGRRHLLVEFDRLAK